jgi:hypothetical protein
MTAMGGLMMLGTQARADLTYTNPSILGNTYTYDLNFLNSIDQASGQPAQRLQSGNFATIYDISGLTDFTLNPSFAGIFTLTEQPTGITPGGTAPNDNALPNLTLTYTGPTVTADQSFTRILTVTSTFTTVNPLGQYTGQTTTNTGASAGNPVGSIGFVAVPGVDATPEPGSFALILGASLSGSVLVVRRRRSRK